MPPKCSACVHPQRAEIDAALVRSASYRDIARQFRLSKDAILRHNAGHVAEHLAKAKAAEEIAAADSLLEELQRLRRRALAILDKAEGADDLRTALAVIREARSMVELLLETEGKLDRRDVLNVTLSPEWLHIQSVMINALEPFPDARIAVAEALVMIEETASHDAL